jgi:hypothetical protein
MDMCREQTKFVKKPVHTKTLVKTQECQKRRHATVGKRKPLCGGNNWEDPCDQLRPKSIIHTNINQSVTSTISHFLIDSIKDEGWSTVRLSNTALIFSNTVELSVADPDRYVFGPPGSWPLVRGMDPDHQAKIVRKPLIPTVLWLLYDFLSLKNDVNIASKSTVIRKKT